MHLSTTNMSAHTLATTWIDLCRAEENFREALEIYEAQLGSDSHLVQDLEHRLAEVKSYWGIA